jgi:hypothetical protein
MKDMLSTKIGGPRRMAMVTKGNCMQFIGVQDNIVVETGKIDGLTYSKDTSKDVKDKNRAFF